MTETLCLSTAVLWKAGANANSAAKISATILTNFINQAEGTINASTQVDWVGKYASLDANDKLILEEAASNLAAMYLINYDMSGYTSRMEATTMLDVLRDGFARNIELLKTSAVKSFLGGN